MSSRRAENAVGEARHCLGALFSPSAGQGLLQSWENGGCVQRTRLVSAMDLNFEFPMAKMRISKIDAGRRQIDAGIRMTFSDEDPIAIHSVVAAGHRIVRDLCEQRGDIEDYLRFKDVIVPGHEKEFWEYWNASANFLKHADRDPFGIHEMEDDVSDFLIVITSRWYVRLGCSASVEMRVFGGWWALQHPRTINAESLQQAGFESLFPMAAQKMRGLDRRDRIELGRVTLERAKARPDLFQIP